MPPTLFQLIIHFFEDHSADLSYSQEPVRCPGCASTFFIRPSMVRITYDVVCNRCKHVYSLTELTFKFSS